MTSSRSNLARLLMALLAAACVASLHVLAQVQPGAARTTGTRGTSAAARQYPPTGTVGEAMISVDPETRQLIVITDEETSQFVEQVVTNLDKPKPQVLIRVVFLEVTYRNSSDIGIEGGLSRRIGGSSTNPITGTAANVFGMSALGSAVGTNTPVNVFGQAVQSFAPVPPGAGLYQIFGSDFQATLRAIAEAGKLEVLSRPSILARNNQQATITVGQSVPLITSVSFNTLTGNPINSVTYQDVGIILRVTPFITADGMVEMIVSPQISALSEQTIPVGAGASAPVINMRSADTVVVTPDGQTVIIGGLMQNQKTQTDSKIPILGDIPLLGAAFKRKAKQTTKTELLIFLTPHIVKDPKQLASLTAGERDAAELAPKAFTESELNRFLENVPVRQDPPAGRKRK